MESLLFDKEILLHLPDVYAVNAMSVDGGMIVMAGSETRHLPCVMSYPLLNKEEIVNCLGGMMSINPVADDGSKLVSVMGLFPGFNGLEGGIYSHIRDNGAWNTRLLFPLPFAHRCDVLNRDGRRYVFMASVSKHKANPDDWSMPGETYCGVYNESTGSLDDITCIDASLTRNHGMLRYELPGSDRECIYVSGREGIYEYDVVSGRIESRRIFDGEVSEFAFVDINGDGNVELVTIEPFHGNRLNVYRPEGDGGWMQIFSHTLVFGHGLSAGTLDGKALIAVGNRRGDASLIVFGYDKESESIEKVYEEPGTGTTQSLFVVCNGVSGILCANQAKQEVVIYKLIKMNNIVNERDIQVQHLPGRDLWWLFTPEMKVSESFSMNVVNIKPGATVSPAHSHPTREEIIYVVSGTGKAYIDGKVHDISGGTAVLFPKGSIHMLRNTGDVDMKVCCFFTPQATMADYEFHESVVFPENQN